VKYRIWIERIETAVEGILLISKKEYAIEPFKSDAGL
jgi:hypothetical protein